MEVFQNLFSEPKGESIVELKKNTTVYLDAAYLDLFF